MIVMLYNYDDETREIKQIIIYSSLPESFLYLNAS